MTMRQVSIIGAGHVGTTLGILFARHGYEIADVFCRSLQSAQQACRLIGSGRPVTSVESRADIYAVTTTDDSLPEIATSLVIQPGAIVFHSSGATPASVFSDLQERGALIASIHPVKTFTKPTHDADTFPGTWCTVEGDAKALSILEPIFQEFGAHTFPVDGGNKVLYHTALVFICNYLFPLIEAGLECFEAAGIPRSLASKVIEPILHETVDNALRLGPAQAISGPIARGDDRTVAKQLEALAEFNPRLQVLYAILGSLAVDLSAEKGIALPEKLAAIQRLFGRQSPLSPRVEPPWGHFESRGKPG